MILIFFLLFFQPTDVAPAAPSGAHPADEICNVMTAHDPHPCTPEQRALLYTAHEHDSAGNLILMTKGAHGEVIRTTVSKAAWLKWKAAELGGVGRTPGDTEK
jgi:hypothetical protein